MLLDGHNRYKIGTRLGIKHDTCEGARLWIVSNQIARRNLTLTQRAALAVEFEKEIANEARKRQRKGKKKIPYPQKGQARDKAARRSQVNPHYVTDAKQIGEDAPEVCAHMKQGKVSLAKAQRVAALGTGAP